ncbi:MAG: cysteine-rich small domain-containing protein [Butyrivibrio sp.]|nr:cysteine-rich small domain-containing protein [Butyrivibrio sp.]
MDYSSKFFSNKDCEYYPCHSCDCEINCLFCYCPLYNYNCPGDYTMVDKGNRMIKSCRNCAFPHRPENYETVISLLKKQL